jgi:hypothetical protein
MVNFEGGVERRGGEGGRRSEKLGGVSSFPVATIGSDKHVCETPGLKPSQLVPILG